MYFHDAQTDDSLHVYKDMDDKIVIEFKDPWGRVKRVIRLTEQRTLRLEQHLALLRMAD